MTSQRVTAPVRALALALMTAPAWFTACDERFDFDVPRDAEQSTTSDISSQSTGDGSSGFADATHTSTSTTTGEPDAGPAAGCSTDTDCRIASLRCHPALLGCVECLDDADCSDPDRTHCDDALFRCVSCSEDAHCAEGSRCDLTERRCARACGTTADCVGAHACRNSLCVTCDRDIECRELDAANPVCSASGLDCVSCREDAQCPRAELCDVLSGRCVACLSTDDCSGDTVCDPELLECVGG